MKGLIATILIRLFLNVAAHAPEEHWPMSFRVFSTRVNKNKRAANSPRETLTFSLRPHDSLVHPLLPPFPDLANLLTGRPSLSTPSRFTLLVAHPRLTARQLDPSVWDRSKLIFTLNMLCTSEGVALAPGRFPNELSTSMWPARLVSWQ